MRYDPNRADRPALDVERNQQALLRQRKRLRQIGIAPLPMRKQQWHVSIKHVATRTEAARRASAQMRRPLPCDRRPVEALAILRQQAQARRAGLQKLQGCLRERLQDCLRRIGQGLHERHQGLDFGFVVGWTARALGELLDVQNRLEGHKSFLAVGRLLRERYRSRRLRIKLERIACALPELLAQRVHLTLQFDDAHLTTDGSPIEPYQLAYTRLQLEVGSRQSALLFPQLSFDLQLLIKLLFEDLLLLLQLCNRSLLLQRSEVMIRFCSRRFEADIQLERAIYCCHAAAPR